MNQNIVVIDDDAAVRGAFQLVLEGMGFTVRLAENGLQGIELAKLLRPDLIFLDLKMPGIDGVETMRRLLAMDGTLKIYIVTAFSQDFLKDLKVAQDEGMIFQLASKPLSSTQIRHITNSVCVPGKWDKGDSRITLSLYVMSTNHEVEQCIAELTSVLQANYLPGFWTLNVVEVLSMPEKALERDVFATPMLVRDVPEPVLKLLGNLSKMPSILVSMTAKTGDRTGTVVM